MALTDKFAKQEMKSEYSDGFIDITYYSKDDLSKLSIGDFVKFSGTFCFSTATHMTVDCENNNFDIKVNYTPAIDKINFNIGTKYQTTFKGIWDSFVADLLDIESSFSKASEYKSLKDYFKEYDDIAQEVDLHSESDSKSEDLLGKVKDDNSKSILDKLLEQQYWNTELAKENEDLSKKLTHAQGTNRDFKKQVETLSKQVETLTIDRDNLSNQVKTLQSKLVDLADKLNKSRKQALEQHNKVLKQKDSNEDVVSQYNNLVEVYNHLRKDYFALQEDYKVLKTPSTKSRVIKIIKILILSPFIFGIEAYIAQAFFGA